jgi:hypothetical protein
MRRLNEVRHSIKLIWRCGALAVLAMFLLADRVGGVSPFVIPSVLMVGAMMWTMMGGIGGGRTQR